jgi:hypothetical protein
MLGISDETINCMACTIVVIAVLYIIWYIFSNRSSPKSEGLLTGDVPPVDADTKPKGASVSSVATHDDGSYDSYIKQQALESTVEENHKKWLGETPHRTTTASTDIDLSGDRFPVPYVGLRRPMMRQSDPDNAEVRSLPSEPPETMPYHTPYIL